MPWSLFMIVLVALWSTPVWGDELQDYTVGPQDVLSVQVYNEPDLSGNFSITASGELQHPLLGRVSVNAKTVEQVAEHLRLLLLQDFLVDPRVTVTVQTYASQAVQVLGGVRKPGTFHLAGPTRLLEVLADAGGMTTDQAVSEIQIQRAGSESGKPYTVSAQRLQSSGEGDVFLKPGDVVYVREGLVVYVSGEVNDAGAVPFQDGMTLTQALIAAGGPLPTARLRSCSLLRDGEVTLLNVKRIMQGRLDDVSLQPGDQVFLEQSIF